MFEKLKKIFYKNKEDTKNTNSKRISSITFEVNTEGNIGILCEWPEFNSQNSDLVKDVAQYYAMMLYSINNGILEKEILKTLKNCNKSNPFNFLFYENVVMETMLIDKQRQLHHINNEPLISPIQVFKEN